MLMRQKMQSFRSPSGHWSVEGRRHEAEVGGACSPLELSVCVCVSGQGRGGGGGAFELLAHRCAIISAALQARSKRVLPGRCRPNLWRLSSESSGGVSGERASAAADGDPGPEGLGEDLQGGAGARPAGLGAFTGVLAGGLHHQSRSAQVSNASFHRSQAAWRFALVPGAMRTRGGGQGRWSCTARLQSERPLKNPAVFLQGYCGSLLLPSFTRPRPAAFKGQSGLARRGEQRKFLSASCQHVQAPVQGQEKVLLRRSAAILDKWLQRRREQTRHVKVQSDSVVPVVWVPHTHAHTHGTHTSILVLSLFLLEAVGQLCRAASTTRALGGWRTRVSRDQRPRRWTLSRTVQEPDRQSTAGPSSRDAG